MILQSRTKQDVIAVNRQKVTSRIHSLGSLELCTYFYTYLKKIGTYPSSTVIQSLFLPVALSPGWADRLDGEGREACLGRGRGDMEKSEQGLKNEEINLPGGRQPRPVLHKAVLGPPRMLAGGGGRSWLLPGPLPPLPSWVPAPHW